MIACTWPAAVTGPAFELSRKVAEQVPGTAVYPAGSIHSSVANRAAPEGRFVDPEAVAEDREMLEALCKAVEGTVRDAAGPRGWRARFGPALLAPRMALVFSEPDEGLWSLTEAIVESCESAGVELVPSWGPHLTLTRFASTAGPRTAAVIRKLLAASELPAAAEPEAVVVGFYTVEGASFRTTTYRLIPLRQP